MKSSNNQLYLVMFCAWLCLLKSNIARCLAGDFLIFFIVIYYFVWFYLYNETFSFYLIIGQLISLFHAGVFWLFHPTLVPALKRYMLTEPEIWGILSTEEMPHLVSNRFSDACEDYPGVFLWLSFTQGVVSFHL